MAQADQPVDGFPTKPYKAARRRLIDVSIGSPAGRVAKVCAAIGFTTSAGSAAITSGYTFTLANSIQITQLGFWDYQANGLSAAVPMTIWNGTGTTQATATVPAGTTTGEINQYLYVTLATPVTLATGTYPLGGYVTNSNDFVQYNVATITGATRVTYGATRSVSGNAYPAGNAIINSNGYFGPNFQFANAVPELSTWAAVAAGAGLLGLTMRRRSRRV